VLGQSAGTAVMLNKIVRSSHRKGDSHGQDRIKGSAKQAKGAVKEVVGKGRNAIARLYKRGLVLLVDDVHAQFDALVADKYGRAGDELAHLVLALPQNEQ
jgi:hypothetical protein